MKSVVSMIVTTKDTLSVTYTSGKTLPVSQLELGGALAPLTEVLVSKIN